MLLEMGQQRRVAARDKNEHPGGKKPSLTAGVQAASDQVSGPKQQLGSADNEIAREFNIRQMRRRH